MKRTSLYFMEPKDARLRQEELEPPGPEQVLIESLVSAVSAGTELLFFRGEVPPELSVDSTIPSLAGRPGYPLKYGYAVAGRIVETGSHVDRELLGRTVFVFHPHESHFAASLAELIMLPEDVEPEDAVFLPFAETAVTLLMDARPVIGERVVVFGQGVIGLLAMQLLAMLPLKALISLDRFGSRRERSRCMGAHASLDPSVPDITATIFNMLDGCGADFVLELSGHPETLNQALAVCGFGGRLVIGSWYGTRRSAVDFGGRFHRERITVVSSQVSSIAPELGGRWTRERRQAVALEVLRRLRPASLITHRIPFNRAAEAYELLDRRPEEALQIVFTYGQELLSAQNIVSHEEVLCTR